VVKRVLWLGLIIIVPLVVLVVICPYSVTEVVVGALISIWVTMLLEGVQKPNLELELRSECATRFRAGSHLGYVLQLRLVNKPLPRGLGWLQRNSATEASGTITFRDLNGKDVFGAVMPIRWSNSPQPGYTVVEDTPNAAPIKKMIFNPERLSTTRNIPPGSHDEGVLDVAARFDNESECYGVNNESYFNDWHTPRWKLLPGEYLVDVKIRASNASCADTFHLSNEGSLPGGFRLAKASKAESARVNN